MRPLELIHLDENGNPSWRFIVLRGSLSSQFLVILEQFGDLNGHALSKMRRKILGYNTYHSESPGHDTNDCWALKNKVQDLLEA